MYIAASLALLLFLSLSAPGLTASTQAKQLLENNWSPNTSLWSSARIAEFRALDSADSSLATAVLSIPDLDVEVPVYDSSNPHALQLGLEHVADTADFESGLNIGLAGHRDGFFRGLKGAELGQKMVLTTRSANQHYVVTDIEIVDPAEVAILAESSYQKLTLITCYPFYFVGHAPQRFIVHAQRLSTETR